MKKLWMGLAAAALVMSLCVTGALAAGRHGLRYANADGVCGSWGAGCGFNFTDADGDGICNYRNTSCGGFVDTDGDGFCDNCGTHCGVNYVDVNGDGICDLYNVGQSGGHGGHHGRGACRNQ